MSREEILNNFKNNNIEIDTKVINLNSAFLYLELFKKTGDQYYLYMHDLCMS